MLKILFVTPECAPLCKVGGLGDVVAALPKALRALSHDARVILPCYGVIDRERHGVRKIGSACVHLGQGREVWVGLLEATLDGEVPVWLIEHQGYYGRRGIYDEGGQAYGDNLERFALLSKAALQVCKDQHFIPDIMHVHDWPTALSCAYLKTWDRVLSPLSRTASVLTIHNIGYQGHFPGDRYPELGIGQEHFRSQVFEDHGGGNLLKAGIHFADAITTVSPSYAREITQPEGGQGLSPYLHARSGDVFGILNGADYSKWDPRIDSYLPARYGPEDMSGKARCKAALQRALGLPVRPNVPLFGVVTRLTEQKGISLLRGALQRALQTMELQVVVVGNGDPGDEGFFTWLHFTYPSRAACYIGYSEELSHLTQAGSDFFLMPSIYEPCGLTQMYALRYGTLPVVRATGGLDDTIDSYDEESGTGTGFKFNDATVQALYDTIGWAVSTYFDRPAHITALQQQAMSRSFLWREAAEHYVEVYRYAMHRRHG